MGKERMRSSPGFWEDGGERAEVNKLKEMKEDGGEQRRRTEKKRKGGRRRTERKRKGGGFGKRPRTEMKKMAFGKREDGFRSREESDECGG